MGRANSSWLILNGYMTYKLGKGVIPFSGGGYLPVDQSLWGEVDPV